MLMATLMALEHLPHVQELLVLMLPTIPTVGQTLPRHTRDQLLVVLELFSMPLVQLVTTGTVVLVEEQVQLVGQVTYMVPMQFMELVMEANHVVTAIVDLGIIVVLEEKAVEIVRHVVVLPVLVQVQAFIRTLVEQLVVLPAILVMEALIFLGVVMV
jgi:hypothetical protein